MPRRALDEALRQPQAGAEQALATSHLARVGFVVVAGKMEQAVENENFDFSRERVALLAAWRSAVGTLMARSPAIFSALGSVRCLEPGIAVSAGNESTSVALFLPRKRRLRLRRTASVVSRTVTSPRSRTAACAAARKRARVRAVGRRKRKDFAGAVTRFTAVARGAASASRSESRRIIVRGAAIRAAPGLI